MVGASLLMPTVEPLLLAHLQACLANPLGGGRAAPVERPPARAVPERWRRSSAEPRACERSRIALVLTRARRAVPASGCSRRRYRRGSQDRAYGRTTCAAAHTTWGKQARRSL